MLSALPRHAPKLLSAVVRATPVDRTLVAGLIATIAGTKERTPIDAAAIAILDVGPDAQPELWRLEALATLLQSGADAQFTRGQRFGEFRARAARLMREPNASSELRAGAVGLLGWAAADRERDMVELDDLLGPQNPAVVQVAALQALGRCRTRAADEVALKHWSHLGPALRQALLDTLLARDESADRLVAALERGAIATGEIDAAHRQRMLDQPQGILRERAGALFARSRPQSRQQVLEAYRGAAATKGDSARGKAVFRKTCASCHKYDGQGHEVGPDLAALTDRSPEALLTAVLDPNREVDARYASYTAALKDGRILTGLIASETGNAITLKRQEAQSDVILRADLEEIKTSGQSLMPEGLEHDLNLADVADLFAYLADTAPRPRAIAGNQPRTVGQATDGKIRLDAATAEIYGPNLTFETEFHNLGYWHSAEDHAGWTFRVERGGTYTVAMEWACADESAGNAFDVHVGNRALHGTVGGTGPATWSQYRSLFLGELSLEAGVHRLAMRPAGAVRGALLDLRAIVLTPRIATGVGR